jgi:deoxyribonuclease-4
MICGAHESVAGGLHRAFERATVDGCKATQIFTKNSNQWKEPTLSEEQIAAFRSAHASSAVGTVMAHTSYLINLATDKEDILARSIGALVAEIERSSALGIAYVVLHPGAHLGLGVDQGLTRVAQALDEAHERTKGASARILLENTAGQGTCVGCSFEELGAIFEQTKERDRMGVCFDTQHAYASGYDLSTADGYAATWEAFDKHVGLARLSAFHLNDSKKALGSRVDRHEHVGEGLLGLPLFWRLVNDPKFSAVPGVLETEGREGDAPFRNEVSLLNSLVNGPEPKPKPAPFTLELAPSPAPKKSSRR